MIRYLNWLLPTALVAFVVAFALPGLTALAAEIEVDELSDFDFGQVPPSAGELTAEDTFCVALLERGSYQITAVTDAPGGEFVLLGVDGVLGRGVAYRVFVNERGGGRGDELMPGVPLTGLRSRARLPNGRCPRPLPRITVTISAGALGRAPPGVYRGALGLTVSPE